MIMKHSYLSGISVKEVIRRVTPWMEDRVKPDYTQMSIDWSRKSLKVLKKHF